MKTKNMLVLIAALAVILYFGVTSAFGWPQWIAETNPQNTPIPNDPWVYPPPDTINLEEGESIWIGIPNEFAQDNQKFVYWTIPVSEPFDGSKGVGGYYNGGASHSRVVTEHSWFTQGNPDLFTISFILDPQPEWEVIKITNNDFVDVDLIMEDATVKTLCWKRETYEPVYKFVDVSHDGPEDSYSLIELTMFPVNAMIDVNYPPNLNAPEGTGPWFYDFVFEDPYGNPMPQGGVRWMSAGPGMEAYFSHYDMEFAMMGEVDYRYSYFVFDEYSGEYIEYDLYTGCPDVSMEPDMLPVEVPQGGSFGVTGIIGNTCDEFIRTDIWYGVIGFGNFYQQGRFSNIPLNPGQYISAHLNQHVPMSAPPGEYEYCAYCGDYPDIAMDEYCFPFTVIPGRTNGGADVWRFDGGFETDQIPNRFTLIGNYPNPFNAVTTISYELPEAADVTLSVYNLLGQKVVTLMDGVKEAGVHQIQLDASNYSSGLYFYRLSVGEETFTKRMTVIK
ncbi:MAG: T9SS type A sorting domain-containing protein [candidate division Zixibacteria bacterium]|nr:T9SS type A sorting domain-containing protein [candidate division Zixibacteria bacterium]